MSNISNDRLTPDAPQGENLATFGALYSAIPVQINHIFAVGIDLQPGEPPG